MKWFDETEWHFEYSPITQGYPFHICPASKVGRPPDHWQSIFHGSYEEASAKLKEIVNDPNRNRAIRFQIAKYELLDLDQVPQKTERRKMNSSLRYKILKRDSFRCVICGQSASDGIVLHIDHIKPIAKGGLTTPENLQTLCSECNFGKGTDY